MISETARDSARPDLMLSTSGVTEPSLEETRNILHGIKATV